MATDEKQDALIDEGLYLIVKGRFKSDSLNLYGVFLIVFNPEEEIESQNIIVSTYSNAFNIEPHVNWERYEESITELKWKGNFNSSMTSSLMDQIKAVENDERLRAQFYNAVNNYDYDSVEIFVSDFIYRIIHDKNLILETGIQEVPKKDFKAAIDKKKEAIENSKPLQKDYNIEDGSVVLNLQPILAPVKGKPLYELKIGDKIMTKILPNSDRENYFIDLLDLRVEDHIKPVASEVIDIKAPSKSDPIEILTQIGPGIYGKIVEEERQVKLRIYDPLIDGAISKKEFSSKNFSSDKLPSMNNESTGLSKMTYLIIGLFILIMLIFIILLYVSL